MAIYNKTYNHFLDSGDSGNRCVYINQASVSAALAIDDKVRPVLIPAGTKVDRLVIKHTADMDTHTTATLEASIGFEHADGSSGASDVAVAAAGANGLTAACSPASGIVYNLFPPVILEKDSYLVITCTTAAAAMSAASIVHAKVLGECLGVK
jgi:hypothetical protein